MKTSDPAPLRQAATKALGMLWWIHLLRGLLYVVIGLYMLIRPGQSAAALALAFGILLVLEGVFAFMAGMMGNTPSRSWTIVRAIVFVVLGLFVLFHPVLTAGIAVTTLLFLIAFSAIVCGILEIVAAIRDRKEIEGEGWLILGGILSIAFGVLLLAAPLFFGLTLIRFLGVCAVIIGIGLIVFAIRLRTLRNAVRA